MMQSDDTIIAYNFSMKDGGITAYGQNGGVVGVSDPGYSTVAFTLTNNATAVPSGKEYCMVVSLVLPVPCDWS